MKLRPVQLATLVGLLAVLLVMASGLAAQEATPNFPLTATSLANANAGIGATATITPLPSLTPGAGAAATTAPTEAPAVGNPSVTPLPSLTPGARITLTPLPSLTPFGQLLPTQPPTDAPPATRTPAPSLTPLPSLTPGVAVIVGEAVGQDATPSSGEVVQEETTIVDEAQAQSADLAPIRIVVPSVSPAQEAPPAPEGAAGLGTLVLLLGLAGATVVGLLMLARDRYRDHRDE